MFHYPVVTLGPGLRLGVWVQGCKAGCYRCMSPEMQSYDERYRVEMSALLGDLEKVITENHVTRLTLSGGEPFDNEDLDVFLSELRRLGIEDFLCYSGYTLAELKARKEPYVQRALSQLSVLIDGRYVDELNDGLPLRGSSNQVIHYLDQKVTQSYEDYKRQPRQFQVAFQDNIVVFYGLLPKNFDIRDI